MNVVVLRSPLKMWLMALGGIPLLVISIDVLTSRRITRWLTDIVFRPEDVQIFEPRDVIFAWVLFLFGALFVIWGLKELFVPTKVVECREEGLAVRLNGPHRPASVISWENIQDVGGADVDDEGDLIPLLIVTVFDREDLPENPWGARWVAQKELGLMAQDWDDDPQQAAEKIADYAIGAAQPGRRERSGAEET
jgi:hypothetical protein